MAKKKYLSMQQRRMLRAIHANIPIDYVIPDGSSYSGGASGTWQSLIRHGLIEVTNGSQVLTTLGQAALSDGFFVPG